MTETTPPALPAPDPALKRFDRFVGDWELHGHLAGSDEETITGRMSYRWLPGGYFFEQSGEIVFAGSVHVQTVELIGFDPETGTFPSRVYSNMSPEALPYTWALDGDDLAISVNYGPLDATFHGKFSTDGDSFTGSWGPNPGADPQVNIAYTVTGRRVA